MLPPISAAPAKPFPIGNVPAPTWAPSADAAEWLLPPGPVASAGIAHALTTARFRRNLDARAAVFQSTATPLPAGPPLSAPARDRLRLADRCARTGPPLQPDPARKYPAAAAPPPTPAAPPHSYRPRARKPSPTNSL